MVLGGISQFFPISTYVLDSLGVSWQVLTTATVKVWSLVAT